MSQRSRGEVMSRRGEAEEGPTRRERVGAAARSPPLDQIYVSLAAHASSERVLRARLDGSFASVLYVYVCETSRKGQLPYL